MKTNDQLTTIAGKIHEWSRVYKYQKFNFQYLGSAFFSAFFPCVTKVLIDQVVCKLYSVELAVSRRYCYWRYVLYWLYDVKRAVFVPCAIWRTKGKATCVTEWFREYMAEPRSLNLNSLAELSGRCLRELECMELQPKREKHWRSEREHQSIRERERRGVLSTSLCYHHLQICRIIDYQVKEATF